MALRPLADWKYIIYTLTLLDEFFCVLIIN